MSSAATELTYHGRPLTAQPSNMPLGRAVEQLKSGRVARVTLEPGDGTRYDLILAPILSQHGVNVDQLAVVRTHGYGDFCNAALITDPEDPDGPDREDEFGQLADYHAWTARLFSWWFSQLWERINV